MSSGFDWQTEEEAWADRPRARPPRPPGRWRRWLAAGLLVAAAVALGSCLVRRQLRLAAAAAEGQVRAAHTLALTANRNKDVELFRQLVDPNPAGWSSVLPRLAAEGSWLQRPQLGLAALDPGRVEITLEPDLREAELRYEVTYRQGVWPGSGVVTLWQTVRYRQNEQGWQLVPLPAAAWGGGRTRQGDFLQVDYPARDEAVAGRLAADLDAALAEVCAGGNCPPEFGLRLTLGTAADDLARMTYRLSGLRSTRHVTLATISLVGEPRDEAAYQALKRGYLTQLLIAMAAEMNGAARPLPEIDEALAQLDLPPWVELVAAHASLRAVVDGWLRDGPFAPAETADGRPDSLVDVRAITTTLDAQLGWARVDTLLEIPRPFVGPPEEPVAFEVSTYYRRHLDNSWVFFGESDENARRQVLLRGTYLIVTYPLGEAPVVGPLAGSWDRAVATMCGRLPDGCPPDFAITLAAGAPLPPEEPELFDNRPPDGVAELILPSPAAWYNLTELPLEPAARALLGRQYLPHLWNFIFDRITGSDSSPTVFARHRALYREALAAGGMLSWPPPIELEAKPASLPTQPLQVLCTAGSEGTIRRLHIQRGGWETVAALGPLGNMVQQPASGDLFIQEERREGRRSISRIWRWPAGDPRQTELVLDWWLNPKLIDLAGLHIPADRLPVAILTGESPLSLRYAVDLNACDGGTCALRQLGGETDWSPDGRHTIIIERVEGEEQAFLGDAHGNHERALPSRGRPVWVEDGVYAMIGEEGREVQVVDLDEERTRFSLTREALAVVFPASRLEIAEIRAVEGRLLLLLDGGRAGTALVAVDPDGGAIEQLAILPEVRFGTPAVSPGGRWINLYRPPRQGEPPIENWFMIERATRRVSHLEADTENGGNFQWSADDNWLVLGEGGLLRLVQPESGVDHQVAPELPGCWRPHWVLPADSEGTDRPDAVVAGLR